jgi:hypothetical protein
VQEELANTIEALAGTLDPEDNAQLAALLLSSFANIGGNASQVFKAAAGVADNDVVTKSQLEAAEGVQSVGGSGVDNTDPNNPTISLGASGVYGVYTHGSVSGMLAETSGSIIIPQSLFKSAVAALTVGSGDQTWQNVTGSRSNGVTYTNTTNRPIMVIGNGTCSVAAQVTVQFTVAGSVINQQSTGQPAGASGKLSAGGIVPPGATYTCLVSGSGAALLGWWELR